MSEKKESDADFRDRVANMSLEEMKNMSPEEQERLLETARALLSAQMASPDRMAGLTPAERDAAKLLRERELAADPDDTGVAWKFEVYPSGHLSSVSLRRQTACNDVIKKLVGSPQLAVLDLAYSDATDVTMTDVGRIPYLFEINLQSTVVTDAGLAWLGNLKTLDTLNLYDTRVTAAGLACLCRYPTLAFLCCNPKKDTMAAISHIAACDNLSGLYLSHSGVSDEDFTELARLQRLAELDLSWTKVTSRCFPSLAKLRNLRCLNLWCAGVGDDGMDGLGELTGLQELDLSGTQLSDIGVANFGHFRKLKLNELQFRDTKITDHALLSLLEWPNCGALLSLRLEGTKVTKAGVDSFQKHATQCVIATNWGSVRPTANGGSNSQ